MNNCGISINFWFDICQKSFSSIHMFMNNIVRNNMKSSMSNIAMLVIFCLFAFAGKSYAWHFGPETDASKWEYEKAFALDVKQITKSSDAPYFNSAASVVGIPFVEISGKNDGLLPEATGNLVYRKIQTLSNSDANQSLLISFSFTAIREANYADGIYPQNCYFDICFINAEGDNVEHHYKAIDEFEKNVEKKTYTQNDKTYYIVTGKYVLSAYKTYSAQDIQIRVWPQSGVNFHKLLISNVEAQKLPSLPSFDNDKPDAWVCESMFTTSFKRASPLDTDPPISEKILAKPYVYLQGEMQSATSTVPAMPGYLPQGKMSRTVKGLKAGEYKVKATVFITHIGNSKDYPTRPSNCYIYTGKSYTGATDVTATIKDDSFDSEGYLVYPSSGSPYVFWGYRKKAVELKAVVGTDGELQFTIWNYNSSDTKNFNFVAIQNFTVTAVSSGAGIDFGGEFEENYEEELTTPPDDVPLLTVSPTTSNKFTHYEGIVYHTTPRPSDFPSGGDKEWKTSTDDPRLVSGVKLQRTHEYVHDIYVMPGEQCELLPFSDFHTALHGDL